MRTHALIFSFILSPFILIAQEDTVISKGSDSVKVRDIIYKLLPRTLIIKMKDLKKIKNIENAPFEIIDDTTHYTEGETYPAVSSIRKMLGIAKTAGVILILILSLL